MNESNPLSIDAVLKAMHEPSGLPTDLSKSELLAIEEEEISLSVAAKTSTLSPAVPQTLESQVRAILFDHNFTQPRSSDNSPVKSKVAGEGSSRAVLRIMFGKPPVY